MNVCRVCETNEPAVGDRCRTCYGYFRRTGKERPQHLANRQAELNRADFERKQKTAQGIMLFLAGAVSDKQELTTVYRYYDEAGKLLYVGVTGRSTTRQSAHASSQKWWSQVYQARFEHYPTRRQALLREAFLIAVLEPLFNTVNPWSRLLVGGANEDEFGKPPRPYVTGSIVRAKNA